MVRHARHAILRFAGSWEEASSAGGGEEGEMAPGSSSGSAIVGARCGYGRSRTKLQQDDRQGLICG